MEPYRLVPWIDPPLKAVDLLAAIAASWRLVDDNLTINKSGGIHRSKKRCFCIAEPRCVESDGFNAAIVVSLDWFGG